jgi:hypothetical protein
MDVATAAQRQELKQLQTQRGAADEAFRVVTEPLQPSVAKWEVDATNELQAPRHALAAQVDFEPEGGSPRADTLPRAVEKGGVYYEPGLIGQAARFDGMQHLELPADTLDPDKPWTIGVWVKATASLACVLSKIEPTGDRRGFEVIWQKGQVQVNLVDRWVVSAIEVQTKEPAKRADWNHVVVSYDGSRKANGLRVFIDGLPSPVVVTRDSLQGTIANSEPLRIARRDSGLGCCRDRSQTRSRCESHAVTAGLVSMGNLTSCASSRRRWIRPLCASGSGANDCRQS